MVEVGRLSASKITTFFGCPMAYFLEYVAHEKVPQNIRMVFGKSIHYILDRFYEINYKSTESFVKFWKHYWFKTIEGEFLEEREKKKLESKEYPYTGRDENGKRIEKILLVRSNIKFNLIEDKKSLEGYKEDPVGEIFSYMKIGEKILAKFYNRHKDKEPPIEKEKRFYIDLFGHPIVAILDRIDKYDGAYFLTDYKTDKFCPHKNSFILHRHPQFTIYSGTFREIFQELEKNILYYHLRSGNVLKTKRSQKDFDYLKLLMDTAQKRIENGDFVPFYGFHCKWCDFQVPCEKYSVAHGGPRIDLENRIIEAEKFLGWHTPEERKFLEEREAWLATAEER